jgi:hypothetical protein
MSWGYWGIVGGLVAMVGMLLACIVLSSSKAKESFPTQSDKTEVAGAAPSHAPDNHRQAA